MKKLFTLLVVAILVFNCMTAVMAAGVDPAAFGWDTDAQAFTGWDTTDGVNFTCDYANKPGSKSDFRIWKDFIEDGNNFALSLDAYGSTTTDLYVKLMGVCIELKYSQGKGDQFIVKLNGTTQRPDGNDWQQADGGKATVSLIRKYGGDLEITVTPGGGSAISLSAKPTEADNENLEVGLYRGGTAKFENIVFTSTGTTGGSTDTGNTDTGSTDTGNIDNSNNPVYLAGWETEGDPMDFTGWNMSENGDFDVAYFDANYPHLWKSMITDKETFTLELDIIASGYTSPYIKVLGNELELDGNNGDGNSVFVKFNRESLDWYPATNTECHVTIWRENGGDVHFLIQGKDNASSVSLKSEAKEDADTLEIGLYRGTAAFKNIAYKNGVVPENKGDDLPPIVKPTEPAPTETKPVTDKPVKPAEPKNDATLWIVLGACGAAAVIAVVLIVVIKKRSAK